MIFYLGTHMPNWMRTVDVPLFVSRTRMDRIRKPFETQADWCLDSGAFSEIEKHGEWTVTSKQYAESVQGWATDYGRLQWVSPMDWMCEPWILKKTGLSVKEHQVRSIDSVVDLRNRISKTHVIPVLQGWSVDDYLRHADMYQARGIDLVSEPIVGVGSVCRRQATDEAGEIVSRLFRRGIKIHGFGMKIAAIKKYGHMLESADSMAWSYAGRRRPDPNCPKRSCANCLHYALEWRDKIVRDTRPLQDMVHIAAENKDRPNTWGIFVKEGLAYVTNSYCLAIRATDMHPGFYWAEDVKEGVFDPDEDPGFPKIKLLNRPDSPIVLECTGKELNETLKETKSKDEVLFGNKNQKVQAKILKRWVRALKIRAKENLVFRSKGGFDFINLYRDGTWAGTIATIR